jgi:MFS family permease
VLQAGAATLPGPTLSTVVAGPAGKLADRFGHRAVIVPGTIFFAAGVWVLRSANAVNAAFRQIGAVLGTAILVAIVGEPATLSAALAVSDDAYLFSVIAALVSGAVVLGLRRPASVEDDEGDDTVPGDAARDRVYA